MRIFLVLVSFFIIPFSVWSQGDQKDAFSSDLEKFPKEMEAFLSRSNKTESERIGKELETVWESQFYGAADQKRIIAEANDLVKIKVKNFPDLANFVSSIVLFPKTEMTPSVFNEWFGIIEEYSANSARKKELSNILKFSTGFFESKSLFKTQSKSVDWRVDNYSFKFNRTGKDIKLVFDKITLSCHAKGSSIEILETKGVYSVLTTNWIGEGGKVTFERADADPNVVWIDLSSYDIDMKHSNYEADSVIYHNNRFLKEPLLGTLTDKVLAQQQKNRVSYPRFQSVNVHIPIKNLVKDVDYLGGFAQQGAKIIGTGTDEEPALLSFYRENKVFMKVTSKRFLMEINAKKDQEAEEEQERKKRTSRNSVVSSDARVVIYMDGDSITHPGLKLNFYTDERLVNLVRVKGEMSETPYFNSFHKVEMRFELLNWNMDYPIIEFKSFDMSSDKSATFESESFFREKQYESLMGASSWHPLVRMKSCATKYDTNVLSLRDITGCLQVPVSGVEPMLMRYTVMGYLDYNQDIQEVKLYPKLFHQVNSRSGKEDYDVLNVYSKGVRTNATLNLMNFDLTIKGVNSVVLSSEHNVRILPDSGTIVMKRNRDFDFNGIIASGKVDFYGNNFSFDYDAFKIDMPILDSMQIWASTDEVDKQGYSQDARVRTLIEQLQGDLKIDRSDNKSGKEEMAEYPIFSSKQNSYAFYDKRSVFNKVYSRNDFYFELKPFEIDSLDKFTNEGISFEGVFYSAGIFPNIEESLTLQEDYSLGFKRIAPPGGYPLYGNKGTFKNEMHLSDEGLKGSGFINYLTSTAASDNFYFFPKQVQGLTKMVQIEEQFDAVQYPNVSADTTRLRWKPYDDEYFLSSVKKRAPITMFGGKVRHTGRLKYTPKSLTGRGVSAFEGAKLYSDSMLYTFYNIKADTANFELGQKSLETLDFSSENVNANIDFKNRKGEFVSNSGASLTNFGLVMYQAYLDRFTWFMDEEELELSAAGGKVKNGANEIQVEGAQFVSVNPKQDSLSFYAKSARYSVKDIRLQARKVALINVADAEVIPKNGDVVIHENARMERLDSSIIIANSELRYHKIYDARTTITGRWKYSSNGKYDYVDENGLAQIIELTEVDVDTTRQTFATGLISSEDDFTLSPMYQYRGNVSLKANRKNLNFKGYGKLQHECTEIPATWFSFNGEVDPNEIVINIDENVSNLDQSPLRASLIMPRDSGDMYGSFVTPLHHGRDIPIALATGYLQFNSSDRSYRISNLQKLSERSFPGNYAALNIKSCELEGEGQLVLSQEMGHVKVQTVGNYLYNTINKKATFNTALTVDFLFDDGLLEMIIEEAKKAELESTSLENPIYELTLRELLGKEKADDMIGKLNVGKNVKVPDELRKTMFFSDVKFIWNQETDSYISRGKLSVGNMGKNPVNMQFDGGIELIQKRGYTDVTVYLEISPSNWYVFSYRASTGMMKVYSSSKEFLAKMSEVKSDNKKLKGGKNIKPYVYIQGTKRTRSDFVLRLEDAPKL